MFNYKFHNGIITILVLFIFISGFCNAQTINIQKKLTKLRNYNFYSEKQMLAYKDTLFAEENIVLKAEVLISMGNYYHLTVQQKKADSLYDIAISLGEKIGNNLIVRKAKIKKAKKFIQEQKLEKAELLFKEYLNEAIANDDNLNTSLALYQLGIIKKNQHKIDSAFYYYSKAIELAEISNHHYNHCFILNNLAILKYHDDQDKSALSDYNKALQIAEKHHFIRQSINIRHNLALIDKDKGNVETAKNSFKKISSEINIDENHELLVSCWINISNIYFGLKQYNTALIYLDSCKIAFPKLYDKKYSQIIYLLARCYYALGNDKEALNYVEKAIIKSKGISWLNMLDAAYLLKSEIYEEKGEIEKSFNNYKLHKLYSDSSSKLTNQELLTEMGVKYEVGEKEKEIIKAKNEADLLEKENELQSFKYRIFIAVGLLISIVVIILLLLKQQRGKRKQQEHFSQELLKNIDKERSRIARDLHDDLGQQLSLMKNKIHLKNNETKNLNEIENSLTKIIEQTRTISRTLHPSNIKNLGLKKSIQNLCNKIENDTNHHVFIEIDEIDNLLNLETKTHLFRIIQECINNSLKHANSTAIKLKIKLENRNVNMNYYDNGKGLKVRDAEKGMGYLSMRERANIINGELEVKSKKGEGTQLIFKFKNIAIQHA